MFKTFNEYTIDTMTVKYINNQITEHEYFSHLDTFAINEGLSSIISSIKQKVLNALYTFLEKLTKLKDKSAKIAFQIVDKAKSLFEWATKHIYSSDISKNNPILFKTIVMGMMVLLLMILTSVQVHAASANVPVPTGILNYAIGWLDNHGLNCADKSHIDAMSIKKGIAILMKAREHKGEFSADDAITFGKEAKAVAQAAIDVAVKNIELAKKSSSISDNPDAIQYHEDLVKNVVKYIQDGAKFLHVQFEHVHSSGIGGFTDSEQIKFDIAK